MVQSYDMHPPGFHSISNSDRHDLDDKSNAEPLKQRDSSKVSSSATHEGHEVAVIHRDGEEHGESHEAP